MRNSERTALDAGRLQLLREVSLRGTIAAAARKLGLTASAVSQQLSVLEREAGVTLLDRSPRGVVLTGAGKALAARAAELGDVLAAARADLDVISGSTTGLVSLACVPSAAATFVSEAAIELRSSEPGIELSVAAAEPATALSRLLAGDVDVAIVDEYDYVPMALPAFVVVEELLTEPLVVVSPPGSFPVRHPRLRDLHDVRWIMPPIDAACGIAVRSACRAAGFEPKVSWETDDLFLLMVCVSQGHGVAVLPRLSVAADAAVDVKPLRDPALERRILAVARASVRARPVVASALDAISQAALRHTMPRGG
jgi:DNA-binding transcriptional LysR family regulator